MGGIIESAVSMLGSPILTEPLLYQEVKANTGELLRIKIQ